MKKLLLLTTLFFGLQVSACGDDQQGNNDAGGDTIVPANIDSYVSDTVNQAVCIGIDPTAGITEEHHAQCAEWGVDECSDTGEQCLQLFANEPNNSSCCCETCGIQQGKPTCFFLVCP